MLPVFTTFSSCRHSLLSCSQMAAGDVGRQYKGTGETFCVGLQTVAAPWAWPEAGRRRRGV